MGFFSLNSSQWELSVVCQQIFSISYRFRDKGAKNAIFVVHKIFIFHPILMGFFFIGFLSMRAFRIVTANFFYLLPLLRYKGPKRVKKRFLRPYQIFIFHPILMGFFYWIPLSESFQNGFSRFFLSLTVFEI